MQVAPDIKILREVNISTEAFAVTRLQSCLDGVLIDTDRESIFYSYDGAVESIAALTAVDGDTAFSWHKRCYKASWLYKWPMKSQSLGRKTKRYFVLTDDKLSYFESEAEALAGAQPREIIEITDQTNLKVGTHFKCHCISLKSPTNSLWFTAKTPELENEWFEELSRAMSRFANKSFLSGHRQLTSSAAESSSWEESKSSIAADSHIHFHETTWSPQRPGFTIIAVDATEESNRRAHQVGHAMRRSCSALIVKVALFGKPGDYLIEAGRCDGTTDTYMLLDVPRQVQLSMVHLMGNYIVLCGNIGWLSVFDTRKRAHIVPSQSAHYKESKILTVASISRGFNESGDMVFWLASGDRLGGLAQWSLDCGTNSLKLILFTDIHEAIVTVNYLHRDSLTPTIPGSKLDEEISSDLQVSGNSPNTSGCSREAPILFLGSEKRCCLFNVIDSFQTAPSSDYAWCLSLLSLLDANTTEADAAFYALHDYEWNSCVEAAVAADESQRLNTEEYHGLTLRVHKVLSAEGSSSKLAELQFKLNIP